MSLFRDFYDFQRQVDAMFRDFDRQFSGNPRMNNHSFLREPFIDDPFFTRQQQLTGDQTAAGAQPAHGAHGAHGHDKEQTNGFEKNTQLTKPNEHAQQLQGTRGGWLSAFPSLNSSFSIQPLQCKVDVIEQTDKYFINAELPGIKKEEIKLDVHNNMLTLSAERKHEVNEEDGNQKFVRRERSYGSITRSMQLPSDVELNKIEAKHENGVLKITLPRMEIKRQENKNTIQIQ